MSEDKMPDVIWARYLTTGTHGIVCEKAGMYHGKNGLNAKKTQYIRADILEQCVEALRKIANFEHDCGCWPCRGQCASAEALKEVIYNMCDDAKEALTAYEKMEK
jgi:hypothetical protein